MSNGPQIACCVCGAVPVVRLAPPLCADCDPENERDAAALWREEHPETSVFDCDEATKSGYRQAAVVLTIQHRR